MNLRVILFIPAAHRAEINDLAESLGYGPNNMSVELNGSGSTWYGCHAQCDEAFLRSFGDQAPSVALSALVVSVASADVAPTDHWVLALTENGLAVIPDPAA